MARQLRFVLCVAGAFLLFRAGDDGWMFQLAGLNAFANLFSGQYRCASGACAVPSEPDAVAVVVSRIHLGSTLVGGLFFLLGVALNRP